MALPTAAITLFLLTFIYLSDYDCVYVPRHAHEGEKVTRDLSPVTMEVKTQVVRLGGKHLYLLNRLTSSGFLFF